VDLAGILADFRFPWDKLLGPIITAAVTVGVAYLRRGARALDAMKANIDEVPNLIAEVRELKVEVAKAHEEATAVGERFADFAEESSNDRKALHVNLHEVRNGMQMTVAVAEAVGSVGDGLGRIANHLEHVMRPPPNVPDGPPRREVDPPETDWRERRRREPYRGPEPA
jgi:hypothetical protein